MIFTLEMAVNEIKSAGYRVSGGVGSEDANWIRACSVESIPHTMGHPKMSVSFNKRTGWLSASGKDAVRLIAEVAA